MRAPADLPNVKQPSLTGRYHFAVFNRYGYTRGVLARTEAAFRHSARRHVLKEGTVVSHGPWEINVVRPSDEMLDYMLHQHAEAVEFELARYCVTWRVSRYVELTGGLPPGFDYTEKDSDLLLDVNNKNVAWVGDESFVTRFASLLEVFSASEGGRSVASPSTATTYVVSKNEMNGGLEVDESVPLHCTPSFYFEIVGPSDALVPLLLEKAELQSLEKGMQAAKSAAREAEQRTQDAADLVDLRKIFRVNVRSDGSVSRE